MENKIKSTKKKEIPKTEKVLEAKEKVGTPKTEKVLEAKENIEVPKTEKVLEASKNIETPKTEKVLEAKEKIKAKTPKIKKSEATVNAKNLKISTKYSVAICKFIKNKKIEKAIEDLEQVLKFKKAVPMKGEIPHKKGKGMMSGRYPKNATEEFIRLLKSLLSNASLNGLENPLVIEAIPNLASRPFGRFGSVRKKRTHVKLVAKEKIKK